MTKRRLSGISQKNQQPGRGPCSRRQFLRSLGWAALAGPALVSCARLQLPQPRFPAYGKLNHACIGVGGMGWVDLQNFLQHPQVQVVALCDVDANHLARAAQAVPGARLYSDWRDLLAKEGDIIDSVNVTVPDHMHFAVAWSAVLMGKHVYCQKPLCHDVAEVRALTNAAIKKRVVTQLGTQAASSVHERTAVAWLRAGRIGKVTRVYLCSNRPGAVENYRLAGPRPATGEPPPKHLDWNLWVGTAPVRPYVPEIYHPVKWRAWQDFGTGWSGDIGCHLFDPVWKGLGLQPPRSVLAEVQLSWKNSPGRRADAWPQANHITWTFPADEQVVGQELAVDWFDGEFYPPEHVRKLYSADLKEYPPESGMIIGTEGSLLIPHGYPPVLLPEERFKGVKAPALAPRNHYHHFVDACRGGEPTESHFAQVGPMTEAILLGTVAVRVPDQELKWDHTRMRVLNCAEANRYLRRSYREGWHLAGF